MDVAGSSHCPRVLSLLFVKLQQLLLFGHDRAGLECLRRSPLLNDSHLVTGDVHDGNLRIKRWYGVRGINARNDGKITVQTVWMRRSAFGLDCEVQSLEQCFG